MDINRNKSSQSQFLSSSLNSISKPRLNLFTLIKRTLASWKEYAKHLVKQIESNQPQILPSSPHSIFKHHSGKNNASKHLKLFDHKRSYFLFLNWIRIFFSFQISQPKVSSNKSKPNLVNHYVKPSPFQSLVCLIVNVKPSPSQKKLVQMLLLLGSDLHNK